MPSRSKSQFGMMGALYKKGKISKTMLEHMNKGVSPKSLPKKVKKKK